MKILKLILKLIIIPLKKIYMKTPWAKKRAEWLKGGITQKQLAEKYKLSVKTIQNRAYKEGWKNQKRKIREKTEQEISARVVRARVTHLEKLIDANEKLLDGLVQMAELISSKPNVTLFDANGTLRNAESFAKALQTATATQRDLYRIPNIDQKFAAKKWREQLKLEKEKAKGESGENGEKLIWVIHEPAEEEGDANG